MSTHVQEIKERLGIAEVISSYIKLEKSGANFKARCPFHHEKTPSFYVSPDRGSFYCFGCNEKGDIFTFVEKFEGLDFMGALKVLADRAGVNIDRRDAPRDNRKETLYDIMEEATAFFEESLEETNIAKDYILKRGLSEKTIKHFRIGFATDEWRALRSRLKSKGFKDEDVESVGLIKKSEKKSEDPYYDTFRNRIIFPIADSSGRIVAFTGRTLDEEKNPPKYLNSPETVLFSKSKILYGLDKAKQDIRKRDYSVLVEGQMDLVMLHQAGFTNVVAASGTAFTENDGSDSAFGLLKKLSDNIVVAFDSDSAGQKAVKRIVPAISLGMNVKIVDIKGGKDPADIIKADPKQWAKMLETKKDFVEYLADSVIDAKASNIAVEKLVKQDIFPYLQAIPEDTPRFNAVKRLADKLLIKEEALWKDLQEYARQHKSVTVHPGTPKMTIRTSRLESIERKALGLLHSAKHLKGDKDHKAALEKVVGEDRAKEFDKLSTDDIAELTLEAEVTYGQEDASREYKILLLHLEEEYLRKRLADLLPRLHRTEKSGEGGQESLKAIMEDIQTVSKRMQEIKQAINTL